MVKRLSSFATSRVVFRFNNGPQLAGRQSQKYVRDFSYLQDSRLEIFGTDVEPYVSLTIPDQKCSVLQKVSASLRFSFGTRAIKSLECAFFSIFNLTV